MARRKRLPHPKFVLDTMVWVKGHDSNVNEPYQNESKKIVDAVHEAKIRVILPTLVIAECLSITDQIRSLLESSARTVEPFPLSAGMGLDVAEFMKKAKEFGMNRKHRFDACHFILAENLDMPFVTCDNNFYDIVKRVDEDRAVRIISPSKALSYLPAPPPTLSNNLSLNFEGPLEL